jgi:hypothetical protein
MQMLKMNAAHDGILLEKHFYDPPGLHLSPARMIYRFHFPFCLVDQLTIKVLIAGHRHRNRVLRSRLEMCC